jgi:hypothetical protein
MAPLVGNGIKSAKIVLPGALLDTRSEVIASCGYKRDCGYMYMTAQHLADVHAKSCKISGCTVVIAESPAPPLDRAEVVRNVRRRGRRFEIGS